MQWKFLVLLLCTGTVARAYGDEIPKDTLELKEVVITARESTGTSSSTSKIDRSAMQHLQPTSFSDLMELLPGGSAKDPAMGHANTVTMREAGGISANGKQTNLSDEYAMTALGTQFMVDGAPISTDAEMQNMGTYNDSSGIGALRNTTNRGVDMRSLSTDNIESVEIIRGIPSAEYGNLTSGLINIRRVRRATPWTARFKADEYSKLFSAGKGLYLGRSILNLDAGYLDARTDPRNSLENYTRVNGGARLNYGWDRSHFMAEGNVSLDYTGSTDKAKVDPDLNMNKIDEYRSRYNRWALTADLALTFPYLRWLKNVRLNGSASYQDDHLWRRKQVAPLRASVAPTTTGPGVSDGHLLLGEYIAEYESDGRPVSVFLKAVGNGQARHGAVTHSYKAGAEWNFSKNYGRGQIYDLTRPLSASWTTRPRAYRDIPSLNIMSAFAEDAASIRIGNNVLDLQAGLRLMALVGLDSRYTIAGKPYLDPRVNAVWNFPTFKAGRHPVSLLLAGGYGLTSRMPTIDYLFPQEHYNDIVQLNYYDVNDPLNQSRVNLITYVDDATNYDLRPARNHKWEVRIGGESGMNRLSVTYFREHMNNGFRYGTVYSPYGYTYYDPSGIISGDLGGVPPSLEGLPSTAMTMLDGYRRAENGTRIDKQGIEFQISTARWKPLATSLIVTGAWFRTRYSNSQAIFQTVNDVVDGQAVNKRYVGLYYTDDGRINELFNTNFMFDTRIRRLGLIFSTTIQCNWFMKTTRMRQNGVPTYYLSADDGQLHPFDPETAAQDPMLRYLIKYYNEDVFRTQTVPIALFLNLKATKTIGRFMRVALFVNRIVDYLPSYKSNELTIRRNAEAYFGMELNFTI